MNRFFAFLVVVVVLVQVMTFLVVVSQETDDLAADGTPTEASPRAANAGAGSNNADSNARFAQIEALVRGVDRKVGNLERRLTSISTKVDGVQRGLQRAVETLEGEVVIEEAGALGAQGAAAQSGGEAAIDDTPRNPRDVYEMSQLGDGSDDGTASEEAPPVEGEGAVEQEPDQ